jgi:hypothetical protein
MNATTIYLRWLTRPVTLDHQTESMKPDASLPEGIQCNVAA